MTTEEAERLVFSNPKLAAEILFKTSEAIWDCQTSQFDDLDRDLGELNELINK